MSSGLRGGRARAVARGGRGTTSIPIRAVDSGAGDRSGDSVRGRGGSRDGATLERGHTVIGRGSNSASATARVVGSSSQGEGEERLLVSSHGSSGQEHPIVELESRLLIRVDGVSFVPREAGKRIPKIINAKYDDLWSQWTQIPKEVKTMWFAEFKKYYRCAEEDEDAVFRLWKSKSSATVRSLFQDIRRGRSEGTWLGNTKPEGLCEKWKNDPVFQATSKRNKKNAVANKKGRVNRSGAISISERVKRYEVKLGRKVSIPEVFESMNYDAKADKWSSTESENIYVSLNKLKEDSLSQGKEIDDSELFLEVTEGSKGRYFGFDSELPRYTSCSRSSTKNKDNQSNLVQAEQVNDRLDRLETTNAHLLDVNAKLSAEIEELRSLILQKNISGSNPGPNRTFVRATIRRNPSAGITPAAGIGNRPQEFPRFLVVFCTDTFHGFASFSLISCPIEITTDDLLQAAQTEVEGMLYKSQRSPEMWKQVAINEAAMAVVAVNFPDHKDIEFVTIAPRGGRELGYVRMRMDSMRFKEGLLSRQSLLDHISIQLAPRAADELWYGKDQLSTIWTEMADNARSASRALVLGGLSEKRYGLNNFWTQDKINEIDSEALRILDVCYKRTKGILERNQELMDAVVENLLERKSLTKREFFNLVELHGYLLPTPPSILDIRSAKRLSLSNSVV
ncbi:AAA-type ATPase family protein [Perilla frutescens var. hirtella]|nr:AAA-type ATPase family protein [Perilla frutescens var. hirtella]